MSKLKFETIAFHNSPQLSPLRFRNYYQQPSNVLFIIVI